MDLKQRKLNRSEWESIEIPVSQSEIEILELIIKGYHDVTIKINNNNSLFTFLKIEFSDKMEDYIYNRYLRKRGDCIEIKLKERALLFGIEFSMVIKFPAGELLTFHLHELSKIDQLKEDGNENNY